MYSVLVPIKMVDKSVREKIFEIECGSNKATLYQSKLKSGSSGNCVLFEGKWITPNEFQDTSGRKATKD